MEIKPESESRWELPLEEHPFLDLSAELAAVSIVPLTPGEAPFVQVQRRSESPFQVEVKGEAGTTRVKIGIGDDFGFLGWGRGLKARIALHVPRSVHARIRSTAGRMRVEDLSDCVLSLETDAGEVGLKNVSGRLRVATQAGRIDGEALRGSFDVSTSAGAVRLEIIDLDPGTHRVHTSLGTASIELARGMPVRIAARTTMGASRIQFPSTKDAAAILEIEAELGAIRVRESHRRHEPRVATERDPYRRPMPPEPLITPPPGGADPDDIEAILQRVANGSLSPSDASALLRALGRP